MTDLNPPWDDRTVEALNRFQHAGRMHPFTCGKRGGHASEGLLVATSDGWVCEEPGCDYTQDWAHGFMTDPKLTEPMAWPFRTSEQTDE